jgi:hypothetical protein
MMLEREGGISALASQARRGLSGLGGQEAARPTRVTLAVGLCLTFSCRFGLGGAPHYCDHWSALGLAPEFPRRTGHNQSVKTRGLPAQVVLMVQRRQAVVSSIFKGQAGRKLNVGAHLMVAV